MSGKLFVIDGVDGSGKCTQARNLYNALKTKYQLTDDVDIACVSFPQYGKPSSIMVEMYLNGEFGMEPDNIDPYTTSMMYMIDRSISFLNDSWGKVYRNGGLVIADRYYTSNIIHQGAKLIKKIYDNNLSSIPEYLGFNTKDQIKHFTQWLESTELNKIGLPTPDKIIWLMSDQHSNDIMMQNRIKTDPNHKTDIHEAAAEYLEYCRNALKIHKSIYEKNPKSRIIRHPDIMSGKFQIIHKEEFINIFDKNNNVRSISDISNEIFKCIVKYLTIDKYIPM